MAEVANRDSAMKGAEAVLNKASFLGMEAVEKFRVEKKYRVKELDESIRRGRTRREARLLAKAKLAGVLCPVVYEVGDFSIRMKFLQGKMLHRELMKRKIAAREVESAAGILVKLHLQDIVHGDFTPANLMLTSDGMAVIDFGLGEISTKDEDKATDIVMMKKALNERGAAFVAAYSKAGGAKAVVRMVSEIEKRARYMERG
ncbi:MAG: KEOPS complex kinase/ATPase Bud32 [Candidatus Anstonellaceae archaeon]